MGLEDAFGDDPRKPIHITDIVTPKEPSPEKMHGFRPERDLQKNARAIFRDEIEKGSREAITLESYYALTGYTRMLFPEDDLPLMEGTDGLLQLKRDFNTTRGKDDDDRIKLFATMKLAYGKTYPGYFHTETDASQREWYETQKELRLTLSYDKDLFRSLQVLYPDKPVLKPTDLGSNPQTRVDAILSAPLDSKSLAELAEIKLIYGTGVSISIDDAAWEHIRQVIKETAGNLDSYDLDLDELYKCIIHAANATILTANTVRITDEGIALTFLPPLHTLEEPQALPLEKAY